jgi:hypothetical protein
MKIQRITWQHRSDFNAIMQCEHCNGTQELKSGYDDSFYHSRVIPAITCISCAKNRSGVIPEQANDSGTGPVEP